jgi:hypothetical protein
VLGEEEIDGLKASDPGEAKVRCLGNQTQAHPRRDRQNSFRWASKKLLTTHSILPELKSNRFNIRKLSKSD